LELQQLHGQARTGWDLFRERLDREHLANLAPATADGYNYALNKFEKLMGKPRCLDDINGSVFSRFGAALRADKHLSTESVRTNLRTLKTTLSWAHKLGLINRVPQAIMPTGTGSRGRAVTLVEFCKFLSALRTTAPQHWPVLSVLCKSLWLGGLRISEALKLSFDSGPVRVDLNREFPAIAWSISGHKSKREEVVPIPPDFARFLRRFNQTGKVIKTQLSTRQIKSILTDAGRTSGVRVSKNKHITAHDLRRTTATRWALRVHPIVLKTMMRHRSLETTLKYYVDLDSDTIARKLWEPLVHAPVHQPHPQPPKPD
jgi:integrase